MNISVVFRVYNRLADVEANLALARKFWTRHNYEFLVVTNGSLPAHLGARFDKCVQVVENRGHILGAKDLLTTAFPHIRPESDYVIFVEADFWLLDDRLIDRCVAQMRERGLVFMASNWIASRHSLACDFCIVENKIWEQWPDLFDFPSNPEQWLGCYCVNHGLSYAFIRELCPVHVPTCLQWLVHTPHSRFRIFPKGPALTHHIEDLPQGMETKKGYANSLAPGAFPECPAVPLPTGQVWAQRMAALVPQYSWFKKKRKMFVHSKEQE